MEVDGTNLGTTSGCGMGIRGDVQTIRLEHNYSVHFQNGPVKLEMTEGKWELEDHVQEDLVRYVEQEALDIECKGYVGNGFLGGNVKQEFNEDIGEREYFVENDDADEKPSNIKESDKCSICCETILERSCKENICVRCLPVTADKYDITTANCRWTCNRNSYSNGRKDAPNAHLLENDVNAKQLNGANIRGQTDETRARTPSFQGEGAHLPPEPLHGRRGALPGGPHARHPRVRKAAHVPAVRLVSINVQECRRPKENVFTCYLCHFTAEDGRSLEAHIQEIHAFIKPLTCRQCDYATALTFDLKKHIQAKHIQTKHAHNANMYACSACRFFTMNEHTLEKHVWSVHIKHCSCDVCKRIKYSPYHRSVKPKWLCSECCYSSATFSSLKAHSRLAHPKVKLLQCEQCDFVGVSSRSLETHVKDKHSGKYFTCDQCHFTAVCKYDLQEHMAQCNVRFFACNLCDYSTGIKSKLEEHKENSH